MTAVEWLLSQKMALTSEEFDDIIHKALEMEKEQIIEAHGLIAKLQEDGSHKIISGETYYDETFG
jgi:hypothetical protein